MRKLISLITAAAFLLHLGLGCCAHHAHAAEGSDCAGHALATADCQHHEHDHDGQPVSANPGDSSDPPRDTCDDAQCVFLTAVKTTLAKEVAVPWMFAVVSELTGKVIPVSLASLDSLAETPPPLPVRLHLFHQQLLL